MWSRSTSATWSSKPAGERRTTGQNIGLGLKRSLKTFLSVSAGIILRLALGNAGRACVSGETARIFVEEYFFGPDGELAPSRQHGEGSPPAARGRQLKGGPRGQISREENFSARMSGRRLLASIA